MPLPPATDLVRVDTKSMSGSYSYNRLARRRGGGWVAKLLESRGNPIWGLREGTWHPSRGGIGGSDPEV